MGKLFGTDGIRGTAYQYPITLEMAEKVGRAAARVFGGEPNASVVVGRDPRVSGNDLISSVIKGCYESGLHVWDAGMIPTPGVAYLTSAYHAAVGIVISASHNPYEDNGFKFFDKNGYKLSDEVEVQVERAILADDPNEKKGSPGNVQLLKDGGKRYLSFLADTWPKTLDLSGLHIVVDCANGATSNIAPVLFEQLGAKVTALFCAPNGVNINSGCGSEHTKVLLEKVKEIGADIGFAFDGDGDRLVAVDEKGEVLSGDQILAIIADDMVKRGLLQNQTVVSTIMSNVGLTVALKKMGAIHIKAGVGDRLVMEKMKETGAILGGEDSGHMIFLSHHTTGDGMLSALRLLEPLRRSNKPLSQLRNVMEPMPQRLVNVPVKIKPPIQELKNLSQKIAEIESLLGDSGRVLVRYSGTQSMCRVMVESAEEETTRRLCDHIANVVRKELC